MSKKLDSREIEGEAPKENKNLVYAILHTWKHTVAGATGLDWDTEVNERQEIQQSSARALWSLRTHPYYFSYPDSNRKKLCELFGNFPSEPKISMVFHNPQDHHYTCARLSQDQDYAGERGTAVRVPEMSDLAQQGILTELILATARKIRDVMKAPHFRSLNESLARRANISVDQVELYHLAEFNYALYIIGYLLPYIKEGTESARLVEEKVIGEKIDNPVDYIKRNFYLDIPT